MSRFYTQDEIRTAREAPIIDLLTRLGYRLIRHGRHYFLPDHDSFCIFPQENNWYWYSRGVGGNTIDFLMRGPYSTLSFTDAVSLILQTIGYIPGQAGPLRHPEVEPKIASAELILPPKATSSRRVIAYLSRTRKIAYHLIMTCLRLGKLYETAQSHNAAFVGYDGDGNPKHIYLRGTGERRFAGDVLGSDKRFGFSIGKVTQVVHIFESPIDLLSFMTICEMQGLPCSDTYLSLSGLSTAAIDQYVTSHTVTQIYIRTDNDEPGHRVYHNLQHRYDSMIEIIPAFPVSKDYNQDLVDELWPMEVR